METKHFLYCWLGKRKYPAPMYYCHHYRGPNAEIRFRCKLRVESITFAGIGDATTMKAAKTYAAEKFCRYLINSGQMAPREYKYKEVLPAHAMLHARIGITRRPQHSDVPCLEAPHSGEHVDQGQYSQTEPYPDADLPTPECHYEESIGVEDAQTGGPKITAAYSLRSLPNQYEEVDISDENSFVEVENDDDTGDADEPLTVRRILEVAISAADLGDNEAAQQALLSEDVDAIVELVQQNRREYEDEFFAVSDELKELTLKERKLVEECRQMELENEELKKMLEAQDEK